MRVLFAVALVSSLAAGCTPYIPVKDDFATTALTPVIAAPGAARADIPPEFAEFNLYDPRVNALLAAQLCATPYQPLEGKTLAASTGKLVQARGRCRTHIPLYGP